MDKKDQQHLIKIGYEKPELRKHIRPILDEVSKTASSDIHLRINNYRGAVKRDLQDKYPSLKEIEIKVFEVTSPRELVEKSADYGGIDMYFKDVPGLPRKLEQGLKELKREYPRFDWEIYGD